MTEQNKVAEDNFPDGKLILPDGRVVDCYPLATAEQDRTFDGSPTADGNAREQSVSTPQHSDKEIEADRERFVKNAFFFLAHKERILTDSRMFLCPVPIRSGISITGTLGFENPTLGVYLLWWDACSGAMRTDKKGRRSLVFRMSGSNLSGRNCCEEVYEDGSTNNVRLYPFGDHWKPFARINTTYGFAKQKYQAYTLQQVLRILDQEEEGNCDYAHIIVEQWHVHEIHALNERVHRLNATNETLERRFKELQKALDNERILHYYDGYLALRQRVDTEIEQLQQQKRDLKAALHRGDYTNQIYESRVNAINQRIKEAEQELSQYKYNEILKVFPGKSIPFWKIELQAKRLREKQTEENATT